jgi:hypothetical protein
MQGICTGFTGVYGWGGAGLAGIVAAAEVETGIINFII